MKERSFDVGNKDASWIVSKCVLKVSPELWSFGGRSYKTDVASTLMLRPHSLGSGVR